MPEDSFIGREFPTPKGGTLIVNRSDFKRNKTYFLSCSICSADKELFPESVFSARKDHLYRGVIPCGCSKSPRLNEAQARIMIKRSPSCERYEYIGMIGSYTGASTKISMSCIEHGQWHTSRMDRVIKGVICPKCKPSVIGKKLKITNLLPDEIMIDKFKMSCVYPEGSIFKRASRSGYWSVFCPICYEDEFCKSGLCSGWFDSQAGAIKRGQRSCRCSNNFKWNQEQRELQLSMECKARGLDFVGWESAGYKTTQSKLIASCLVHGQFSSSVANFMYQKTSCPGCAQNGFDSTAEGYVYALRSDCGGYIKVGISNYPEERVSFLAKVTPFGFTQEAQIRFDSGAHARKLERQTHDAFMRAGLSGFDGCTEWLRYDPAIIEYIQQRAL